jgi:hypothetical protein
MSENIITMEMILISSALTFLAESVNLYNWYLRRSQNPTASMYDRTNEVINKLYDKLLQRAEENNDVSIQLKNTVLKLSLANVEELEDNNICARLLSHFIQNRQRRLYLYNSEETEHTAWFNVEEPERSLWVAIEYTMRPHLYIKLHQLEAIYMDIISYNDSELRISCYNPEQDNDENQIHEPPIFGLELLELEKVYLSHNMGYVEEDDNSYMINRDRESVEEDNVFATLECVIHINYIKQFNCPICFEDQTTGSKSLMTTCGHQYCKTCFEGMTKYKAVCAMCRGEISKYIISEVM